MKEYLSVSEYCKKYGKDPGNIRRLLISGKLKGQKIGNQWAISTNQLPPKDNRIKTKKYIDKRKYEFSNNNPYLTKQLKSMSKELSVYYKNVLIRIVVYGSYARNQQSDESDVDIAMFVKKEINRDKMIEISSKYEIETGKILSLIDIEQSKYEKYKDTLPFYQNISKEGIEIWKKH